MTNVFKAFRSDIHKLLHHVGESHSFRVTGDCTIE